MGPHPRCRAPRPRGARAAAHRDEAVVSNFERGEWAAFALQRPPPGTLGGRVIASARRVIDVDGDVHDLQVEEDARRTLALEAEGLRVIRVRNEAVLANLPQVIARIVDAVTAG